MKTYKFNLENLSCGACANKIETILNHQTEIIEANILQITSKLFIKVDETKIFSEEEFIKKVKAIVKQVEVSTTCTLESRQIKETEIEIEKKEQVWNENLEHSHDIEMTDYDNPHAISKNNKDQNNHLNHVHNHTNHDHSSKEDKHAGHNHSSHEPASLRNTIIYVIVGIILLIPLMVLEYGYSFNMWILGPLYIMAYLIISWEILWKALVNIKHGNFFSEFFLMSFATLIALCVQAFPEAVAVMLFYQIGEIFQTKALKSSRKSIDSLLDLKPDFANLLIDNSEQKVDPTIVKIGQIILVKPNEKIPLDGIIIEGSSTLNLSNLTGESLPKRVEINDEVLSGSVNQSGLIKIKVTKNFDNSTASKILHLIEESQVNKSQTERFISRFANYYTPTVVFLGIFLMFIPPLFIYLFNGGVFLTYFQSWVYVAAVFLVVSCPCALVISVPLGYFGGIGVCSKYGILVKGGNYLDTLTKVEHIVFDKTGTLTKASFTVDKIELFNNFTEIDALKYASHVEAYSSHPIAISILNKYGKQINKDEIKNYKEIAGLGAHAKIDNHDVLIGRKDFLIEHHININEHQFENIGTSTFLAVNKKHVATFNIIDEIKPTSKLLIETLDKMNIETTMLTGDNKEIALNYGKNLGIKNVQYELLPNQKLEILSDIIAKKTKGSIVFVGDGINDSPSISRADVGIAMGNLGSDTTIEVADIVLANDDPIKILDLLKISKMTRTIVIFNITLTLTVKFIFILLATVGFATMWGAMLADVVVSLVAIFLATRTLKYKSNFLQKKLNKVIN